MTASSEFTLMRRGMESLGVAVLWSRPADGRIVFANRAAQNLLDCSERKLLDLHIPEIDAAYQDGGWDEFVDGLREAGALERQTILLNKSDRSLAFDLDCSMANLEIKIKNRFN